MNLIEILTLAAFVVSIGGLVYNAGKSSERIANSEKQTKLWADGLGDLERKNSTRAERRWMLQLADDVEDADNYRKRKRIAIRIREETWRR